MSEQDRTAIEEKIQKLESEGFRLTMQRDHVANLLNSVLDQLGRLQQELAGMQSPPPPPPDPPPAG